MLWPFFILLVINTVNKCACVIVCRGLRCNGKDNRLSLFWGVRQNGRYNSQIKNYIFIMIVGFLIQMLQKVKSTCLNTVCFYIAYSIQRNCNGNCHDTLLRHSKQLLTVLTVLIQLSRFSFLNNTCTCVLFLVLFDSYILGLSNSYFTQN